MSSLTAAKSVLAIASELWGTRYVMGAGGDVYPVSGNGPYFASVIETIEAMQDHLSRSHVEKLRAAVSEEGNG